MRSLRLPVRLRDGRTLSLRAIRADDADRLMEFHGRLSPESRYQRFLGPKPRLEPREARYFASLDHRNRMAFVATVQEGAKERIVGVARFDRVSADQAEVALCVRDDYQGLGLGAALFERLADAAREQGVRVLTATTLPGNRRVLALARRFGARLDRADPWAVGLCCELC